MLWTILVLGLVGHSLGKNTYFITAPKTVYKGEEFSVGVHILDPAPTPTRVLVQFVELVYNGTRTLRNVKARRSGDFRKGEAGSLKFKVPEDIILSNQYVLKVRGRRGVNFENQKNLLVSQRRVSSLIQTDKSIYKGGQVVNFRVVTIKPDLKPFLGSIDVSIEDNKGNRVKQWKDVQSPTGVITEKLQLSEEPNEGQWVIQVRIPSIDGYSTSETFLVQHYELPKFEVKVELPPFGLHSDTEIHGTVKVNYTFGKPVEGLLDLRAFSGNIFSSCGVEVKSVQQVTQINGEEKFVFSVNDIKRTRSYYSNLSKVQIVARVTEKATGKTLNGTGEMMFYPSRFKLEYLPITPSTFKPGLPYTAYVKVTTQDGVPVTGEDVEDVEVYTCADFTRQDPDQSKYGCYQFQGTYPLPKMSVTPSASGIAKINIDEVPVNTTSIKIKAWFKGIQSQKTISPASSRSNNFIQISTKPTSSKPKTRQELQFEIRTTEPVEKVHYMIKARGKVQAVQTHDMLNPQSSSLQVTATTSMAPSAYILVYYTRSTGEVVADGLTFSVEKLFNHKVSVEYNKESATPDDDVDLIVTGSPQSEVYVLAVDQSVLLLKSGNDLTQDKVKTAMEKFSDIPTSPILYRDWRYGYQSSASRFQQFFQEAGVLVISDIAEFTQVRRKYNRYHMTTTRSYGAGAPGLAGPEATFSEDFAPPPLGESGGSGGLVEPERVRNIFPETWYWENKTVGSDGSVAFSAKAPDTITSWVASAFGVDGSLGLGVAEMTAKLLVEKPFFVSLNLPSSVKYGEVVTIQAIVFNYLEQDIPVTVNLAGSEDYSNVDILANGDESDATGGTQGVTVMVPSGSPTSVYFPIRPKIRGRIDIEVKAQSSVAADAVRRTLLVKPEGIRRERNYNFIVRPEDSSVGTADVNYFRDFQIDTPADLVPDTLKVKISITGDIMGLTVENLQNLIRLPTGCGEQSLMKFIPNIFIADYLSATNQLEFNTMNKLLQYLELGYQKQLTYQRYDWSYSFFGDSDAAGSLWLTSFVVRAFQQAKEYIYIDESKVVNSIKWILDRQNLDGSFTEQGTIVDSHLQEDPVSLTAYILASFNVVGDTVDTLYAPGFDSFSKNRTLELYWNVTRNATRYLENKLPSVTDTYSHVLTIYALTIAKRPISSTTFDNLRNKIRPRGDTWYLKVEKDNKNKPETTQTDDVITSHDIIATSYLLLTFLERNEMEDAYKVMRFLIGQRNKNGGFKSSQDTVVALEALSKYAMVTRPSDFNKEVEIITLPDLMTFTYEVNNLNALVLRTRELKGNFVDGIQIKGRGAGVAYLDVSVIYHVTGESNEDFDISTVLLDDNVNGFTLMTCCKVLNDKPTGMAVGKIQIPAGFQPDISNINVVGVRKVEKSGSDVNIYYDKIGRTSTCVNLQASRTNMVTNSQKCYVQVTDYYEPSKSSAVAYLPRNLRESKVCDVCRDCTNCQS